MCVPGRSLVQISARRLAIITEKFHTFSQSLQAHAGDSTLKLGHDHFLPHSFHLIFQLSPFHYTLFRPSYWKTSLNKLLLLLLLLHRVCFIRIAAPGSQNSWKVTPRITLRNEKSKRRWRQSTDIGRPSEQVVWSSVTDILVGLT
jgi:hypothetical protein